MTSMSDVKEEFDDPVDEDVDVDEELEDTESLGEDDAIDGLDDVDDLDDLDDDTVKELKAVDEALSQKAQNARSLAIRRALEQRQEERRLHDDLDYLDD